MNLFSRIHRSLVTQVKDINRKYAEPEIEMTPLVQASLIGLRIYLFTLIGLMLYKFIVVVKQGG